MPVQPDDSLSWAVHGLAVAIAEADVAMSAGLGVSAGDYLAIKHVLIRPGQLGPAELGRLLGMSSGSATALVDRLERAGHLARTPHGTDRRRRVLTVAASTRQQVEQALAPLGTALDALAARLPPAHRAAVDGFLRAATDIHRDRNRAVRGLP